MGDMGELYNAMKADKKERHQSAYEKNFNLLDESTIKFTDKDTTLLIREAGKPKVDFYPHTGRWRVIGKQYRNGFRMMKGGATAFINWYKKQKES